MRIQRLHLKAFGSFTDKELDFTSGDPGLHVIYGPNEAGKSTALRALIAWLFGIGQKSKDNHEHDYTQLRIGGELCHSDGSELAFVRRKGRKNTLLDPIDESPLADGLLAHYLAGVDQQHFTTLCGIDHERLITGGHDLLQQTGDVSQALFSAALGTASLRDILGGLEARADALYRPRASTKVINATLAEYKDALKKQRDATLSSAEWERLQKQLAGLDGELALFKARHEERTQVESRLLRVQRVQGRLAQLNEARRELEQLQGETQLPDDFSDRLLGIRKQISTAEQAIRQADPRLQRLEEECGLLDVATPLLDAAAVVKQLHKELGGVLTGDEDLPGLESQLRLLKGKAKQHLAGVWPGLSLADAAERRTLLIHRGRLGDLNTQYETQEQRARDAIEGVREARDAAAEFEGELLQGADERDVTELRAAITDARQAGDLEQMLATVEEKQRSHHQRCGAGLRQLPLFQGTLAELEELELPGEGTRARFEDLLRDLDDQRSMLEQQQQELASEQDQITQDLLTQRLVGEVPTEEQLGDARRHRDRGWQLIRRHMFEGEDLADEVRAYGGSAGLPTVFEQGLHDADDVVDRLRRETVRVHEHANLLARQQGIADRQGKLESRIEVIDASRADEVNRWRQRWAGCGFEPLSPREMRDWLGKVDKLREEALVLHELDAELASQQQVVNRHTAAVSAAMAVLGEPVDAELRLATLLTRADQLVATIEASQARLRELTKGLADAGQRLTRAEEKAGHIQDEQDRWQDRWQQAVEVLHLPADTLPAQAAPLLEEMVKLFAKLDEMEGIGKRIYGIGKRNEEFEARVFQLADRVKLEREDRPATEVAELLNRALDEARTAATQLAGFRKQIHTQTAEKQEAEAKLASGRELLTQMVEQAAVGGEDELEGAVQRSQRHAELRHRIDDLRQKVLKRGSGFTLEELQEEAAAVDADQIPAELEQCAADIAECLAQLGELRERRGSLTREIGTHDGSDAAADAAEQAEEALARTRTDLGNYLRARAAAALLRQQMEAYRRQNQGPVLLRASEIFARLTNGSFAGLRDELNDKGNPILLGIRPSNLEVPVEGMSEGTLDQLYLALRLATLEQQLNRTEPMPFVVDDILIGFDDERTATCLRVLADLAAQTQVLLFTHHSRVVELADALDPAADVYIHKLD